MLIILCILFVSLLICNYIPPFTMIKNVLSTKLQNLNEKQRLNPLSFISDDGVSEDGLEWIEETIKSEALQELKRLEALLFSEALAYKQQAGCRVANH